jgi:hypothetical protein
VGVDDAAMPAGRVGRADRNDRIDVAESKTARLALSKASPVCGPSVRVVSFRRRPRSLLGPNSAFRRTPVLAVRLVTALVAAAALQCGLSLLGESDVKIPPADASDEHVAADSSGDETPTVVEVEGSVIIELPAEGGAVPPVEDASPDVACTAIGFQCKAGPECCTGQCNALGGCGTCSSTPGTACNGQADCCTGTWCGAFSRKDPFQCQSCLAPQTFCSNDIECCSGHCIDLSNGNGNGNQSFACQ